MQTEITMKTVVIIPAGRNGIVELTQSKYANEPCRICGKLLTLEDVTNNIIFAGYSLNQETRAAHSECWEQNIPKEQWAYPQDESE